MVNNIFNSFFTETFVGNFKKKIRNKNFGEKIINILFSIFMENNI